MASSDSSTDKQKRSQVFISYSHEDKKYLEELQKFLAPCSRGGKISLWDDTKIKAGDLWREQIEQAIASAKVAVLLVSSDFLASDFIANNELPPLLEAAQKEGLRILWIAVGYSLYEETEIGRYQGMNNPQKPLATLKASAREKELLKICKEIQAAVAEDAAEDKQEDKQEATHEATREGLAAAVCYRVAGNSIEFLLVRTTGGRWTFPKGHVEAGEENWFAAQREACEESGVLGVIEHQPLTTYLHEKREWKQEGWEQKIQAFLLRVEKTGPLSEPKRNPTWFSAEKAAEALAEDRKFKYGEEFRRVLNEAVKRINEMGQQ